MEENPGQPQLMLDTVSKLLHLVYFLWYDKGQLARGAKMLAQVSKLAGLGRCS